MSLDSAFEKGHKIGVVTGVFTWFASSAAMAITKIEANILIVNILPGLFLYPIVFGLIFAFISGAVWTRKESKKADNKAKNEKEKEFHNWIDNCRRNIK